MDSIGVLAQALGVAYAAGINVPATVAILGLAQQLVWIAHLPAGLDVVANPWIIALAAFLYAIEFLITLLPGLTSLGRRCRVWFFRPQPRSLPRLPFIISSR